MENGENNTFQYTYSGKQQEEIKAIRRRYVTEEPDSYQDKMTRLRRLDAGVTQKATAVALIFGVIGALILGFGMSLFMSELGTAIGLDGLGALLVGIPTGIIGITLAGLAYPLYNRVTRRERARVAPEILRLTDELMK